MKSSKEKMKGEKKDEDGKNNKNCSIGYDRNVVILTQPKGYIKEKSVMMSFIRRSLKEYPEIIKALENRHIMYNDAVKYIEEKEKKGEVLVIRPDKALPVKRTSHNPEKLKQTYEEGLKAGRENIEKIKEFIKK